MYAAIGRMLDRNWRLRCSQLFLDKAFLPRLQNRLMRLTETPSPGEVRLHHSSLPPYNAQQAGFTSEVETWIETRFTVAAHGRIPVYSYAYKKACHWYATRRGNCVHVLHELAGDLRAELPAGCDSELADHSSQSFRSPYSPLRSDASPHRVFAGIMLVLTLASGLRAIVNLTRFLLVPQFSFLAVDR